MRGGRREGGVHIVRYDRQRDCLLPGARGEQITVANGRKMVISRLL